MPSYGGAVMHALFDTWCRLCHLRWEVIPSLVRGSVGRSGLGEGCLACVCLRPNWGSSAKHALNFSAPIEATEVRMGWLK